MAKAWINGHIYGSDGSALYARDGVIEAIGSDEEITALINDADEVTDVQGACIYPGFISAHVSLLEAGRNAMRINLSMIRDAKEAVRKLTASGQGGWLIGYGLEQELVSEEFRTLLDTLTAPVYLQIGEDACLVNAAALRRADISGDTVIPGGKVDAKTGLLEKEAVNVMRAFLPKYTPQQTEEALLHAMKRMNAHGFTACGSSDFLPSESWGDILDTMLKMGRKGLCSLRIDEQCTFDAPEELAHFLDEGYTAEVGEGLFRIGSLKIDETQPDGDVMIRLAENYNMPAVLKTEKEGELTDLMKEAAVGNNFLGYAVISGNGQLPAKMKEAGFPCASASMIGPDYALCADGIRESVPEIVARYVSQGYEADQVIRSLTAEGAQFLRFQNETGMLKQGMKADLCIMTSPLESDPESIRSAEVLMTVCDGKTVFEK